MSEILETRDCLRVKLGADTDARNPREDYDHLAHVLTVPNRDYVDVDKDGGPLADAWRHLVDRYRWDHAAEIFERWAQIYHGAVTLLDTPHRGPVALWYLLPEAALREELPDASAVLTDERDEYRMWAEGDVHGYVIEELVTWTREGTNETRETWEHVDSCWGFIGYDYAAERAREEFEAHLAP